MPPDLHLHPDRLRAHATTAADLAESLRAVVPGRDRAGNDVDGERLRTAVVRAVRELAELSAVLADTAAAAQNADQNAARLLGRAVDPT